MEKLTKEEINTIIIGIRLQIDECEKQLHNYDIDIRQVYEKKQKGLYRLWEKLEKLN